MRAFWTIGTDGQSHQVVRRIALVNQAAPTAILVTWAYQAYYLTHGARYYLPILLANLLFTLGYLIAPVLNGARRYGTARNILLGTAYVQFFVVTWLIGTGAGVHLFYASLSACMGLFFARSRDPMGLVLIALASVLFLVCHFAFPPAEARLVVPDAALRVMYILTAGTAILVAGGLSYLFRLEIDRAERALTRSNVELERLSGVDALTGLANRRALDAFMTREWAHLRRSGDPVSALLCDVDCFKQYNDHYGHLAGDQCLQRVASTLDRVIRRSSDLAARYGGEEFVIILPLTDARGALHVAEELRDLVIALNVPHEFSTAAPVVTISIGVVSATPGELEEPRDLLNRADEALYRAKRAGRNRVVSWEETLVAQPAEPPTLWTLAS